MLSGSSTTWWPSTASCKTLAIEAPLSTVSSVVAEAKLSLDWEMKVTEEINGLMKLAASEGDHITENFLTWFFGRAT